jgi:hypothetical protein
MSATQHKIYFINRKERDEIRYHHGLNEGHSYDNLTTLKLFLAYGKNVGRAIPFLFRPVINTKTIIIDCHANHQPECRPLGNVILRHFSCALRTSSKNVLVRGLGVSLSLFSQWACSTLVCGGCLRDFSPRQVLGYLYCGIFAICASAFRDFSTLCEGCWESCMTVPKIHVWKECCYTPPNLRRCNSTRNVWDIGIPQTAVFCIRRHLWCLRMDH